MMNLHKKIYSYTMSIISMRGALNKHIKLTVYLLVSQLVPVKPGTHVQLYESTPSTQVAPFWHGELAHSSMSG
jgi:hypothetical protein